MTRGTLTTPPTAGGGSAPAGNCVTRLPSAEKISGTPVAVDAGANSITGKAGGTVVEKASGRDPLVKGE